MTHPHGVAAASPVPAFEVRPRVVTIALVVALAAAAVNATIGVLVLVRLPAAARVAPAQAGAAIGLLLLIAAIAFAYAAALIVLVVLVRAGRPWARTAFFAVSLLGLVSLLAPTVPALVVVALLAVADVLLYRPPVTVWVRSLRGVGRA